MMNPRGQALIESIPLFISVALFMGGTVSVAKWFLIHQRLLIAAHEAAMLYSSGHVTAEETKTIIRRHLSTGSPVIDISRLTVSVGRYEGPQAKVFSLDAIHIIYRPASPLLKRFDPVMEEKCFIKHAPHYGPPWQTLYGPAIPW